MTIHPYQPSLMPHLCVCGQPKSWPDHGYQPKYEIDADSIVRPTRARRTDPETSHEAAASVDHVRESQDEVLTVFRHWGPMTDEEARQTYEFRVSPRTPQSPSGFRTRRSELVKAGLVYDTGERRVGSTGRRMIVWAAR